MSDIEPQNSKTPMSVSDEEDRLTSLGSASTLTSGQRSGTNNSNLHKGHRNNRSRKKKRNGFHKSNDNNDLFSFSSMVKEDHGQPIFGCQFNSRLKEGEPKILATVGSNRVSIYECPSDGGLKLLQVFADPDSEEIFYCCAWTEDGVSSLLAAAGARGIIRIFSPSSATCVKHYLGHGNAVNDLIFHPNDKHMLLSASKDHSLRLWNIKTDLCVAIFGGVEGHRDEVLAADIKISGSYIVSCGMDHSLKVWKLEKVEIQRAMALSHSFNNRSTRPFPTVKENFPEFSTRDIHRNYVDCTKWNGDFVLSKSCENNIVFWKGGKTFQKWEEVSLSTTETTVIHKLDILDCDIWFMRFSLNFTQTRLAVGNVKGKTYVYELESEEGGGGVGTSPPSILSHPKCTTAIRQTAFSRDGTTLVCICDDGTLWRWDAKETLVKKESLPPQPN